MAKKHRGTVQQYFGPRGFGVSHGTKRGECAVMVINVDRVVTKVEELTSRTSRRGFESVFVYISSNPNRYLATSSQDVKGDRDVVVTTLPFLYTVLLT